MDSAHVQESAWQMLRLRSPQAADHYIIDNKIKSNMLKRDLHCKKKKKKVK